MKSHPVTSKWLSLEETAELLNLSPLIILSMIRHGELPVAAGSIDNVLIWRAAVERKVKGLKTKKDEQ